MSKYNRLTASSASGSPSVQPLIYNTYQAYLRRTESHLVQSLHLARANGFSLGVKLVRGAYHPHEIAAHSSAAAPGAHSLSISPDALPPVWHTKPETDACYNACVGVLLDAVAADVAAPSRSRLPTVGVLFGTHNWDSARLILDRLVSKKLATAEGATEDSEPVVRIGSEVTERVTLAQLYGASQSFALAE